MSEFPVTNDQQLIEHQEGLHKEGQEILDKIGLLPELEKHGVPVIVGSFDLELLTRRDIDIEVVVKNLTRDVVKNTASFLLGLDTQRIDLTIMDNTVGSNLNLPNSLYLGVRYSKEGFPEYKGLAWQLDIHFLTQADARGAQTTQKIKERLTPQSRTSILRVKSAVGSNPQYHRSYYSTDIYEAVLDHDVQDLDSFKAYLKTKGKQL